MLRMTKSARVLVLVTVMCGTPVRGTEALAAQPQDECAKLTKKDLTAIRAAVIQYLQDEKPQDWKTYVAELRLSPQGDPPSWTTIGLWKCEVRRDGLALVQMLRPAWKNFFGVYLARQGGRWMVRGEFGGEEVMWLG